MAVEQVFGRRFADYFADGVDGDAQIQRRQFERHVAASASIVLCVAARARFSAS